MTATIVTGDKQLDRFFRSIGPRLQRGAVRKSVSAGGQELVKEERQQIKLRVSEASSSRARRARQRVSKRTGKATSLAKSVAKRAWSRPHKGLIGSVVGPSYPDGAHGHLVERGHDIVLHDGTNTGQRTRPIPFARIAMRLARNAILAAEARKMRTELLKLRARSIG